MAATTRWARYDGSRARPRLNVTLDPRVRASLEKLAECYGLSVSETISLLVQERDPLLAEDLLQDELEEK